MTTLLAAIWYDLTAPGVTTESVDLWLVLIALVGIIGLTIGELTMAAVRRIDAFLTI